MDKVKTRPSVAELTAKLSHAMAEVLKESGVDQWTKSEATILAAAVQLRSAKLVKTSDHLLQIALFVSEAHAASTDDGWCDEK